MHTFLPLSQFFLYLHLKYCLPVAWLCHIINLFSLVLHHISVFGLQARMAKSGLWNPGSLGLGPKIPISVSQGMLTTQSHFQRQELGMLITCLPFLLTMIITNMVLQELLYVRHCLKCQIYICLSLYLSINLSIHPSIFKSLYMFFYSIAEKGNQSMRSIINFLSIRRGIELELKL